MRIWFNLISNTVKNHMTIAYIKNIIHVHTLNIRASLDTVTSWRFKANFCHLLSHELSNHPWFSEVEDTSQHDGPRVGLLF